jgi:uncharacterized membrane protein
MRPDPKIDTLRTDLTASVAGTIDRLIKYRNRMETGGMHIPARRIILRDIERARWFIDFCTPITTDEERKALRSALASAEGEVLPLLEQRTQARKAQKALAASMRNS